MTTPNTDPLVEQLARAMAAHVHVEGEKAWPGYKAYARAVVPTVEQEVKRGQAEALRDMQDHHEREADKAQTIAARGIHLTIADGARARAEKIEKETPVEH